MKFNIRGYISCFWLIQWPKSAYSFSMGKEDSGIAGNKELTRDVKREELKVKTF